MRNIILLGKLSNECMYLSSGTWGTALSQVITDNKHNVAVWSRKVPLPRLSQLYIYLILI